MRAAKALAVAALSLAAAGPAGAADGNASELFDRCVTPEAAEDAFVAGLLTEGWRETTLDGPITVLDPRPELTPENLAAVWNILLSDLPQHDEPERLRTLTRDRNASTPGSMLRRFEGAGDQASTFVREDAVLAISIVRHPKWTSVRCAYVGSTLPGDDRLLFRDALDLDRTRLMQWVRYTDDTPCAPILSGAAATASGSGLSEVIHREMPDLTIFEVRSMFDLETVK
ncbi:MAG: hypothetical protein AAF160_15255 [Pseudomonadota bacterium]